MLAFPNIKINLGLSITEKRPDGYHNLETVFYPDTSFLTGLTPVVVATTSTTSVYSVTHI